MARKPRVVVAGAPHHVYLRGNNRRRLFTTNEERWLWLRCLERGIRASTCALHQLTLMTNHVHLIVTPTDPKALSKLVKRACQRFAQLRNAELEASGKLFEERFQSKVITDDAHCMMTTLYNDANGFRAGLVEEPLAHEWSTGPLHAASGRSNVPRSMWTPSPWYLRLGTTKSARASAYRQLMTAYTLRDQQQVAEREHRDLGTYRRRIERPDGMSAREPETQWLRKTV